MMEMKVWHDGDEGLNLNYYNLDINNKDLEKHIKVSDVLILSQ